MHHCFKEVNLKVIARPASGSPATGSSKFHQIQQQKIIDKAFEECACPMVNKECAMACIGNKWRTFEESINENEDISSKSFSAEKKL